MTTSKLVRDKPFEQIRDKQTHLVHWLTDNQIQCTINQTHLLLEVLMPIKREIHHAERQA